jgi:Family of unknown function (DUF5990)
MQWWRPPSGLRRRSAFDFTVRLGAPQADGRPNFLGPFAQGSPRDRFVYVNAGTRAGQSNSRWDRRAKVPLGQITWELIEEVRLLGPGWRVVDGAAA